MKSNFLKKFNSKIGFLLSLLLKRTEDEVYISKNISFNSVLLMHFKIDSIWFLLYSFLYLYLKRKYAIITKYL